MPRQLLSPKVHITDTSKDLFAYIDESGNEGFSPGRSTQTFVVAAIVGKYADIQRMQAATLQFQNENNKKLKNMSMKNLNHAHRKDLCHMIATAGEYHVTCSCFSKFELTPEQKYLSSYPSMYFVGVKNVVERLSWITKQHSDGKVHIMIGNRNNIAASDMSKYLFNSSMKAGKNMTYPERIGNVVLGTIQDRGMILADIAAGSMFQMIEPQGKAQQGEPAYFNLAVRDNLYSSDHPKFGGIWSNGIKSVPEECNLVKKESILAEGSAN